MKLGVTRQRTALHMRYDSWIYLVGIVCMVVLLNITYTATAPRTPADKLVEVYIASLGGMDAEPLDQLAEKAQLDMPEQQEIVFSNVNTVQDYYADQLTVMLMAQQGNVYIIPASRFDDLAESGAFISLDEYLSNGSLLVPETVGRLTRGLDEDEYLAKKKELEQQDELMGDLEHIPKAVYGLDANVLIGLSEWGYTPMEEKTVLCISAATKNLNGSLQMTQWLYANMMD